MSLALQLASGMCLCVNRENNSLKVRVRIEGKVKPLTELSEGVDCVCSACIKSRRQNVLYLC